VPLNRTNAAQCPCSSTPVHAGETRELGILEDDARFVGPIEQVTKGVQVVVEGEEATKVPGTHSPPVQLTHLAGNAAAAGNLITVPAKLSPPPTASQPTTIT